MLTNMSTIRKSIERLVYLEGIEKSPEFKSMSKKELAALDRERQKLERNLQGIRNMGGAPDAMVAIGADHEDIAIPSAFWLIPTPTRRKSTSRFPATTTPSVPSA